MRSLPGFVPMVFGVLVISSGCRPVLYASAPLPAASAPLPAAIAAPVPVEPLPAPQLAAPTANAAAAPVATTDTTRVAAPPPSTRASTGDDDVARAVVAVFGDSAALHADSTSASNESPLWDIDVRSYETHASVTRYVDLFTTTGRERFTARLSRGSRYDSMIRAKLRAQGMPEDLTYLALIESGYDPHAYSRAAAVGMWQFMSGTARDVGLRVDWWMDERRDPVRSTDGAIRFLQSLQKQFGSLYLAAAAYNGGPGRVARGLTRFAAEMEGSEGEDRFFALAGQDYLRAETKNYVPQLIAAAVVAKLPNRYGLIVDSLAPWSYDSVLALPGTSLAVVANAAGASAAVMKELNPAILRGITPPDATVWLHVPIGAAPATVAAMDSVSADERLGYRTERIRKGTVTVASIAAREGITAAQFRAYNPSLKLTSRARLAAGQSVRIPTRAAVTFARDVPNPSLERYGGSSARVLARSGIHVVRRGETLGGIARRYGLSVSRLQSLNGIKGSKLTAGQALRVTVAKRAVGSQSAAAKKVAARKPAVRATPKRSAGSTAAGKKTARR